MAGSSSKTLAAALLVALLLVVATAAAAGLKMKICNVDRDDVVTSCRSYCAVGSTEDKPSDACCAAMRGVDFTCLCAMKSSLAAQFDADRAVQVPSKCSVRGAPTQC